MWIVMLIWSEVVQKYLNILCILQVHSNKLQKLALVRIPGLNFLLYSDSSEVKSFSSVKQS